MALHEFARTGSPRAWIRVFVSSLLVWAAALALFRSYLHAARGGDFQGIVSLFVVVAIPILLLDAAAVRIRHHLSRRRATKRPMR